MSAPLNIYAVDLSGTCVKVAGIGSMIATGTSVPSGKPGYAPGSFFINTSNGYSYRNAGTLTSCNFQRLGRAPDIVTCTASTLTVTEALHDQKTIVLDRAGGISVTLPVATVGLKFRFIVRTTFTGAAAIFTDTTLPDYISGHALMGNDTNNNVVDWQALFTDSYIKIDLLGTSNSTGGMQGQSITLECIENGIWFAEIRGDAAGTEATPFST